MWNQETSPYNIPNQEPIYAGSYSELVFEVSNPFSNILPDLSVAKDIFFAMNIYGDFSKTPLLRFSKRDNKSGLPRIVVDDVSKNIMTVYIYSEDTIDFDDGLYDFQITLSSIDGYKDSVIGQGQINIYKKI